MYRRHPVQLQGGLLREQANEVKRYAKAIASQVESDVMTYPSTKSLYDKYGVPRPVKGEILAYSNEILKGPHYDLTKALRRQQMAEEKAKMKLMAYDEYSTPLSNLFVDRAAIYRTAFNPEIAKVNKYYAEEVKKPRKTKKVKSAVDMRIAEINREKKLQRELARPARIAKKQLKKAEEEALGFLSGFDLEEAINLAAERPKRKAKSISERQRIMAEKKAIYERQKMASLAAIQAAETYPHLYPPNYVDVLRARHASQFSK